MASKKTPGMSQDSDAFQLMFDSHPAILLLLNPLTGEILDANPAALRFYGGERATLRGKLITDLASHPNVFDPGQAVFVTEHRRADGAARQVQVSTSHLGTRALFAIVQDSDAALEAERHLLRTLLDHAPDRIYAKDLHGRKIISNAADWQSYGKSLQSVLGKSDFDTYPPELAATFWADDQSVLTSGTPVVNREEPGLDGQGNLRWVLTTKVPLRDEAGNINGLVGIGRDITERKLVEDELNESKRLFHQLIESLPQNIYAKDLEGRFIFANRRYCALQGKLPEEIVGKTDDDLHPPDLAEKYRADDRYVLETGETIELEEEHEPSGGKKIFVQVIKTPIVDSKGQIAGTLGIFWDITDRKRAEMDLRNAREQLETAHRELQKSFTREHHLAHRDELTGINNRRSLLEYAEREFNISIRYGPRLSVIMFDVDNFKHINDSYGHPVGDQVLESLAKTVCAELRITDIIGRYGGDEFVVLVPQTSAHEALVLAERIRTSAASMIVETERGQLHITLSMGIAQTIRPRAHKHGQSDTLKDLFRRVDRALYAAKQAGKNCIRIYGANETL